MTTETDNKRRNVIYRLMSKGGLRSSIDAKCCECLYDPEYGVGSWRKQVSLCTSATCPLYPVRTKPKPVKPKTQLD